MKLKNRLLISLWLAFPAAAHAALPVPERLENQDIARQPPVYQEPGNAPLQLPPVIPLPQEENRLGPQLRAYVKAYRFTGNTVISSAELAGIAAPYTGRTVTSEELEELRHKLTLRYVESGYINSGAILPDQEISGNIVTFNIVEGRLNTINISGATWLRPDYVRNRLLLESGAPLNVNSLQQRLVLLQQNGLIKRIGAQLKPGAQAGESALDVEVSEAIPYQLGLTVNNHYSPSVGSNHAELSASHKNLTGFGDEVEAKYGKTSGIHDYSLRYAAPVNARDTTVGFHVSRNTAAVVEAPFDQLNITSNSRTAGVNFNMNVLETPNEKLALGLVFEKRSSQTFLLNLPFAFSAGAVDGSSTEWVYRFSQEWIKKEPAKAVTMRSTFSFGHTPAPPKTGGIGPDARFWHWLGQWQWARKFDDGKQLILLANLQWTPRTLLTLEKLGMGGANTVRGYRETQLLRDKGAIFSAEYRIPVLTDQTGASTAQFVTFIDHGYGINTDMTPDTPRGITSAGVGILWNPGQHWQGQLYAAHAFRKFPIAGSRNLQDSGIHFQLSYQMF